MTIAILLDEHTLPQKGPVHLNIHRSFDINVSAEEARRNVNAWLVEEVSYMMGAGEALLAIGARVVWRIAVLLTASHIGEVGIVGMIDVDVQTGELDTSPERTAELLQRARQLAEDMPPYRPRSSIDAHYIATNLQARHVQPQGDPRQIIAQTR